MTAKIFTKFFFGFAVGVLIGQLVSCVISLAIGNGSFLAVMPQLERRFSNQVTAVIVQNILVGLVGVVFAEASFLFEIESWSLLKQCAVHFSITAVFYVPFIWFCYTPDHFGAVAAMLGNLLFTYFITWMIQLAVYRRQIRRLNLIIEEARSIDRDTDKESDEKLLKQTGGQGTES